MRAMIGMPSVAAHIEYVRDKNVPQTPHHEDAPHVGRGDDLLDTWVIRQVADIHLPWLEHAKPSLETSPTLNAINRAGSRESAVQSRIQTQCTFE